MIELIRKDAVLYAKVLMNLRIPVQYQQRKFNVGERVELITYDEAIEILTRNGNIKFWNGEKYIKLGLFHYYEIMQRKDYVIVDYVEPKKEEPKPQPKVEQPKEEVKPEPEQPKEEVKEEVVKEQPKQQNQPKEQKQNDNKKQRHNNNNNNNKQGGGK